MKTAFQMEKMAEVDISNNNTYLLMVEASKRGYDVYNYQPQDLYLLNGTVYVHAVKVTCSYDGYHLGEEITLNLHSDINIIHMRQDPPFDMSYITPTYLLDIVAKDTLVLNNPTSVRNLPEKLCVMGFSEHLPPTLIGNNRAEMESFMAEHQDIIIKPLYGYHGYGVYRFKAGDGNFDSMIEEISASNESYIMQQFIPEIKEGNKRILFIDGEISYVINTKPANDEIKIYRKSKDYKYNLSNSDMVICQKIATFCQDNDLFFVGIDIIGNKLIEINATSVGTISRVNQLYSIILESEIWDKIEQKYIAFCA